MSWLSLEGKRVLVAGFRNKKSVAWHVGASLRDAGAHVVWSVHTQARRDELAKLVPEATICVCDVESQESIEALARELAAREIVLDGLVHSIAFAPYTPKDDGTARAFHETPRADFLRALDVSCFSLVALGGALRSRFAPDASIVALSISTTRMASESYGYMGPVKAALDASVAFLAKSLAPSRIRVNAVAAGPLKTSASAGIPGYLESYLFAEQATLRHRALETREAADAAVFLLSPRASGINAASILVDAGMAVNHFDRDLVRRATRPEAP